MPIVIMRYISNILLQQTECFHINFIIFIIIIVITIIILIIIFLLILLIVIIMLIIIIIVTPEYMTEVQLCVPWRCDFLHYLCRSYTIRKALLKFSKTHTGSARKSFLYYNYNLHYPWMSFKPNNAWS